MKTVRSLSIALPLVLLSLATLAGAQTARKHLQVSLRVTSSGNHPTRAHFDPHRVQ